MATTGAVQAVRKAQLDLGSTPPERVGVILASATGVVALTDNQLLQFYEINYRKIKTFIIPLGMLDALSGQVSIYFNAQGPNLSVAMACSSD
jgi:3-oxoacyl-[acyl-carrier-protein] synthase II